MKIKRYKNYITWKNKQGHFNTECNRASLENDLCLTIPTNDMTKVACNERERESDRMNLRIRKLTSKECLLLMGFNNDDERAMREIGMSDSAIYHCAGDSIVTTCLMALFGQMLPISENELQQKIEDYVKGLANGKH